MNILLIGLGGMGTCHYMNYQHIPDVTVVGAVGCSECDREAAAQWEIPLYETLGQACGELDVDLVDVCTPTHLHKALVLEAIRYGKHVITEKPIALSSADAQEMYSAAEKQGVQLYVAQVLQFTREVEALRAVVANERYGKPLDAYFERLTMCPGWAQGGWLFDKAKSGLLPFDLHIHDLDVIVSVFGKPDTVSYTSCQGDGKPYAEHYRFQYGYASGLHVGAEAAWFNAAIPFTARWRVYFENGMLICDHNGVTGYAANGETTVFKVEDDVKVDCGINLGESGWFLHELTHLTECARKGIPSPLVPRQRVIEVVRILESIS